MTGCDILFKNKPNDDGALSTFTITDCMVAPNGSPALRRPQITIHLPKADKRDVDGAWVKYDGGMYHVIGTTPALMNDNTPTRWNRYAIAEKIYKA